MPFEELLANILGQMIGEVFGETLEHKLDRRMLRRELAAAVTRAEQRFAREYPARDAELAGALALQTRFADLPSVRAALHDLVARPFHDPAQALATVRRSFADVLPEQLDRSRVDAAVQAFLHDLGQEVLYIPQLRQLYSLAFQKISAESSRSMAAHTSALAQGIDGLRDDLRQLASAPPPPALPPPRSDERPRPWHNLPQRSYTRFVGRQAELERLTQLLLPHPRSRHFVVTLDGIGGVGKSALALELAYRYRDGYHALPADERFEAIIWASAKRTLLTASGIQQRQQTFNTLNDLYREIATVLDQPAILQADAAQQHGLVERALTARRALLIVDNLETVDDEELLSFLREIPDPTKVIVTTRHRIDIAYAIRLTGMPEPDAQALMMVEAARKGVELPPGAEGDLYRRTGGIPLAIVWSIGLISLGHSVESVLRRLGSGHSDIARFCFAESVERIRRRDAYRLLLALALFERHVSRQMLGEVAGLGDDTIGRDDGLAELLQLSLVEQKGDRFFLLPLTQSYALEELARRPELERTLRENWIHCLKSLASPFAEMYRHRRDLEYLWHHGAHLATLAGWCLEATRPDVLLTIMPALAIYYELTGQITERIRMGEIGLEHARLIDDTPSIIFIQTRPLARALAQRGRLDEAEQYLANALATAQRADDVPWQCEVLLRYSQMLRRRGKLDRMLECYGDLQQLVDRLPEPHQTYVRADMKYEMGKHARDRGEWHSAREYFRAALRVFGPEDAETGYDLDRAWGVLRNLGFVAQQLGDLEEAARIYRQCLTSIQQIGSKVNATTIAIAFAALEEQRGNRALALEHAREALKWSRKLGMTQEQAQAEAIIARLE